MDQSPAVQESQSLRKRPGNPSSDNARYPRKRSLKACHVCRARKTKCDNVRPTCGFCASVNISCSYDDVEKDHSTFDPASLEILRQLGQVLSSQDDLMHIVRTVAASQNGVSTLSPSAPAHVHIPSGEDGLVWDGKGSGEQQNALLIQDWFGQQPDSAPTTPAGSTGAAAVQWFGLLAHDASLDARQEADLPPGSGRGSLDPFNGQDEIDPSPLQRATKIVDGQPPEASFVGDAIRERDMWQALGSISLLEREQVLFENFLHRICSWLDLFDTARKFSTIVPHLAARNAGLLNSILALSCYHQSLDESVPLEERADQNSALQYYYQTLHYVQKAMHYSTYQHSLELMATTLIISTYEMLRGSRKDWQQHLQGVFWILKSRQIEVETSSLESTTWWAWLRQDIWVAFRERRRTYSTWTPKKPYADLSSHELALRAIWILAQVINFCAVDPSVEETEGIVLGRLGWAKALKKMLQEWESYLTLEFSELPVRSRQESEVFKPRLIHPQCFGLAMQIHHVSRILICAHEPSAGGIENFMSRQKTIQDSIEIVCGIGTNITEDASSMLSSQCLFIAGMFLHQPRQRERVLEMLDMCRKRSGWPTPSLGSELEQIWASPNNIWGR